MKVAPKHDDDRLKYPMIWDITDLANYSLDRYDDLTKSDNQGNPKVADAKN